MTKEEYIILSVSSGYGTKSAAEYYAETHNKPKYTTDDFIELYHTSMRCTRRPAATSTLMGF